MVEIPRVLCQLPSFQVSSGLLLSFSFEKVVLVGVGGEGFGGKNLGDLVVWNQFGCDLVVWHGAGCGLVVGDWFGRVGVPGKGLNQRRQIFV